MAKKAGRGAAQLGKMLGQAAWNRFKPENVDVHFDDGRGGDAGEHGGVAAHEEGDDVPDLR